MPIARFEMPDGRIAKFEVPEGTTPEQAQMQIESMVASGNMAAPEPAPAPAPAEEGFVESITRPLAHVASGVNTGILNVLDIPAYMAEGVNWLGEKYDIDALKNDPVYLSELPVVGDTIAQAKAPVYERGERPALDALRTGGEWASGGAFSKAAKASVLPDMLLGATTAAADYVTGDKDTADLFGLAMLPTMAVTSLATNAKQGVPFTNKRALNKAMAKIEADTGVPADELAARVEAAQREGLEGTVGQLTGDQTLYNMEGLATDASGMKTQRELFQPSIVDRIDNTVPTANVDDAVDAARAQINQTQGRLTDSAERAAATASAEKVVLQDAKNAFDELGVQAANAADTAVANADDAKAALDTGLSEASESMGVYDAFKQADQDYYKAVEQPAWDNVPSTPVPAEVNGAISSTFDNLLSDLKLNRPAVLEEMQKAYGPELKDLQYLFSPARKAGEGVKQVANRLGVLRSRIAEQAGGRASGWSAADVAMTDMVKAADDALRQASPELAEATALSKTRYDAFKTSSAGRGARRADPEVFTKAILKGGQDGAIAARELRAIRELGETSGVNVSGVIDGVERALRTKFAESGMTAQRFLKQYSEVLNEYPELAMRLDDVVELENAAGAASQAAKQTAQAVRKEKGALTKALAQTDAAAAKAKTRAGRLGRAVDKTTLNQYAKNPIKTVTKLLNDPDGVEKLAALNARMQRLGQGEAFTRQALTNFEDTVKLGVATPKQQEKVLSELSRLKAAGVVTDAQYGNLMSSLERAMGEKAMSKVATYRAADNALSAMADARNTTIAVTVSNALPVNNKLALTSLMKRTLDRMTKGLSTNPQIDTILANPEAFLDAAKMYGDKQGYANKLLEAMVDASKDTALRTRYDFDFTPEQLDRINKALAKDARRINAAARAATEEE